MAQDQMSSLFGTTPEALQAQRDAALQQQAMQYAKMDPFQRSTADIYSGASRLGTGVAGMMGAQDPEMMRTTQRQALFAKARPSDAAGWQRLAQELYAAGDPPGAQEALAKAAAMEKDALAGRKTLSEVDKNDADAAANRYKISSEGQKAEMRSKLLGSGKWDPSSVENFTAGNGQLVPLDTAAKPSAEWYAIAGELGFGEQPAFGNYLPEQIGAVNKLLQDRKEQARAAGKSSVTVNGDLETAGARAMGTEFGKGFVADVTNVAELGVKASKALPKMYEALNLIQTQDITTGLGSSFFDVVNQVRAQYLNDKKAGKNISNSQLLDALVSGGVFNAIADFGIGARGIDTPKEKEFLLEVVTGKRSLNKEALLQITQMRIKDAEANVSKYNEYVDAGKYKKLDQITDVPTKRLTVRNNFPTPNQNPGTATPQPTGKPTVSGWNN